MEDKKKLTKEEKKALRKQKRKNISKEFKEFISRGSVLDLAVGVIVGGAFTKIVNSLTNDVLMPFIGALFGKADFKALKFHLWNAEIVLDSNNVPKLDEYGQVIYSNEIYYGRFIQNILDFLLIALVLFSLIKIINSVRRKSEEAAKKIAPALKSGDFVITLGAGDITKIGNAIESARKAGV